jgi:hypothetical protein
MVLKCRKLSWSEIWIFAPGCSQTLEKILDLPQQESADHSKLFFTERLSDCINSQIDPARNNKGDPVVGPSLKPHMVKDSCHYFCAAPSWVQLWLNVKQDDLTCEKTRSRYHQSKLGQRLPFFCACVLLLELGMWTFWLGCWVLNMVLDSMMHHLRSSSVVASN